jgi:ABC-type phosphate/phosphonate transport system substrate-binding protein
MPSDNNYAYLGMYDFPALRPAQDAWWSGLAGHFKRQGFSNISDNLNRSITDPYDIWLAPNLFFAQTCGFPLTHRLAGKVRLLGTPCYAAPGCEGPVYRSLFIVRSDFSAEKFSNAIPARIAVNSMDSYSGWHSFLKFVESLGIDDDPFNEKILSGSHANSIDLVREGAADIAAIDCVTHALIGDVEPERLLGTRVLDQSLPAPGLPFITRTDMSDQEARHMVAAIEEAFRDSELAGARRTLRLSDFVFVPLQDYANAMIKKAAIT